MVRSLYAYYKIRGGSRNFRRGFPLVVDPRCRGLRQTLTRFKICKSIKILLHPFRIPYRISSSVPSDINVIMDIHQCKSSHSYLLNAHLGGAILLFASFYNLLGAVFTLSSSLSGFKSSHKYALFITHAD